MALKTVVESLDGLDEAVKALYAEADGKFVLQVEGIDAHPDVANLKSAYERTKADRENAKSEAKKAKEDLASALKDKPDADALVKLRDELETKINTLTVENGDLKGKLTGATRDLQLAEALKASHITDPTFIKAATAMLAANVKMDGEKAIVETDMGPLGVADHVKRWAASEGKAFVTPPAGGGAKGSESQNGGKVTGNMGGTPAERRAAIQAKIDAGG